MTNVQADRHCLITSASILLSATDLSLPSASRIWWLLYIACGSAWLEAPVPAKLCIFLDKDVYAGLRKFAETGMTEHRPLEWLDDRRKRKILWKRILYNDVPNCCIPIDSLVFTLIQLVSLHICPFHVLSNSAAAYTSIYFIKLYFLVFSGCLWVSLPQNVSQTAN